MASILSTLKTRNTLIEGEYEGKLTDITDDATDDSGNAKQNTIRFHFTLKNGVKAYLDRSTQPKKVEYEGRTFTITDSESTLDALANATMQLEPAKMVNVPIMIVVNENRFISTFKRIKKQTKKTFAQ